MKRTITTIAAAGFFAGAALLGSDVIAQQKAVTIPTRGTARL